MTYLDAYSPYIASVYSVKILLNYSFGSNAETITTSLDLSIPTMQFIMAGHNKPTVIEDIGIVVSAASVEDMFSSRPVFDGAAFKAAIKEPTKALCKYYLPTQNFMAKNFICEFTGVVTSVMAVKISNNWQNFSYSDLSLKSTYESIAKTFAAYLERQFIEVYGSGFIAAEALYRIVGNSGKLFIPAAIDAVSNILNNHIVDNEICPFEDLPMQGIVTELLST